MAVTLYGSGTQTATVTTEHSLQSVTAAGVYTLHVDCVNMLANDVLELRVYQIALTGGTKRVAFFSGQIVGAQPTDDVMKVSIPLGNDITDANSIQFTLKQTFGTSRNYPWKVLAY